MAASRELGIPSGTIKKWRAKAGRIGPPQHEEDPDGWAQRKREGANETWEEARAALSLVRERLTAGDERKAKDAALTMAILLDKSAALEQASTLYEERRSKLEEGQAQALALALMSILDDLDIPRTDAVREVVEHHLKRLGPPEDAPPRGPAPRAREASADQRERLRTLIEAELRAEIEAEVRAEVLDQQSRLLPERASEAATDASDEEEPEAEVVQGEVVVDFAERRRRQADRPPRIGPDI